MLIPIGYRRKLTSMTGNSAIFPDFFRSTQNPKFNIFIALNHITMSICIIDSKNFFHFSNFPMLAVTLIGTFSGKSMVQHGYHQQLWSAEDSNQGDNHQNNY